jgi:hypothetical protein
MRASVAYFGSAQDFTLCAGTREPGIYTLDDDGALELGEHAAHGQHSLPAAVDESTFCWCKYRPTPCCLSSSMNSTRCCRLRPMRSIDQAATISSLPAAAAFASLLNACSQIVCLFLDGRETVGIDLEEQCGIVLLVDVSDCWLDLLYFHVLSGPEIFFAPRGVFGPLFGPRRLIPTRGKHSLLLHFLTSYL